MRVKISALTRRSDVILFNYNYARHSAIYTLIEKSSSEYSRYLHDRGFINEAKNKRFKLLLIPGLLELAMQRVQDELKNWRSQFATSNQYMMGLRIPPYEKAGQNQQADPF